VFIGSVVVAAAVLAVASVVFAVANKRQPYSDWELWSVVSGLLSLVGVFTILWWAR
jgi:hypothetical protein